MQCSSLDREVDCRLIGELITSRVLPFFARRALRFSTAVYTASSIGSQSTILFEADSRISAVVTGLNVGATLQDRMRRE